MTLKDILSHANACQKVSLCVCMKYGIGRHMVSQRSGLPEDILPSFITSNFLRFCQQVVQRFGNKKKCVRFTGLKRNRSVFLNHHQRALIEVLFPWRAITWAFRWNEVNEISGERGSGSEADFADILPHRIVVHFHDCWMISPRRVVRRRQMVISSLTCGS